jgi:hypothetical protein
VIALGIEPASDFPFGPYPNDKLTYKNKETVEYETPAHTDGLGTASRLQKNADPIRGAAILVGPDTDLLSLSVRLPHENGRCYSNHYSASGAGGSSRHSLEPAITDNFLLAMEGSPP